MLYHINVLVSSLTKYVYCINRFNYCNFGVLDACKYSQYRSLVVI
jgi:hypothetical protein